MQTTLTQISTPNTAPASSQAGQNSRVQPSASAPEGDFQRTLNRQLEQRQLASRNAAQAQTQAARPAPPPPAAQAQAPASPPAPADQQPAKAAEPPASQPPQPNGEAAPAQADQAARTGDEGKDAEIKSGADHAADMLALVGSIQLAMQQPAAGSAAALEAGGRTGLKADGKGLTAAQLLAAGKPGASTGEQASADSELETGLGQAHGKAALAAGAAAGPGKADLRADGGKLAFDAQLAASTRGGAALAETLPKETPADLSRLAAQLQPGALQQAAAAAAGVPGDKLMGRVGTPAWDQQLGQKVVWMAAGGDQSATLTLNPPDLGPLQVVLTVTNDQADAAFMSAQPEVRQALEAALPRLREMMSEAGIAFGSATVTAGSPEQQGSGERQAGARAGNGDGQGGAIAGGEIAITQGSTRGRPSLGEVDTFA